MEAQGKIDNVHQGEKEVGRDREQEKNRLADILEEYGIMKDGHVGFQEGEGAVKTQKKEHKEQQSDPMDTSWKLAQNDGPRSKDQGESTNAKLCDFRV